MSITRSVWSVLNTLTPPPDPAGTMAALAAMVPVGSFSVETSGCGRPVGQVVRNPNVPEGTAVKLSE